MACPQDPLIKYMKDMTTPNAVQGTAMGEPIPTFDQCDTQVDLTSDDKWLIIAAGLPRTGWSGPDEGTRLESLHKQVIILTMK